MKEVWKLFMVPVIKKPIKQNTIMAIPKDEHQNIVVMIATDGEILTPIPLTIEQEAYLKDFYKKNYKIDISVA